MSKSDVFMKGLSKAGFSTVEINQIMSEMQAALQYQQQPHQQQPYQQPYQPQPYQQQPYQPQPYQQQPYQQQPYQQPYQQQPYQQPYQQQPYQQTYQQENIADMFNRFTGQIIGAVQGANMNMNTGGFKEETAQDVIAEIINPIPDVQENFKLGGGGIINGKSE